MHIYAALVGLVTDVWAIAEKMAGGKCVMLIIMIFVWTPKLHAGAGGCSEAEDCAGEKVCRGAFGELEMQERWASFQACQTAAPNLNKKTLNGSLEPPYTA